MKIKLTLVVFLGFVTILLFTACNSNSETANNSEEGSSTEESQLSESSNSDNQASEDNILVAYFSVTNNTEEVAQKIAEDLDANIYEIIPEQPYTEEDLDYDNLQSRSSVEMEDPDSRPAISGTVDNMDQYDTVFLGYPIWWGEAPRIMNTFIESYDFSGKTIIPFCTSSSSGFGSSDATLRLSTDGATWIDGQRFPAGASSDEVTAWIHELGFN